MTVQLRAAGAFLVSSKRTGNVTQFIRLVSEVGSPCLLRSDMPGPWITDPAVPITMIVCVPLKCHYDFILSGR
jgi:hypothetical protein